VAAWQYRRGPLRGAIPLAGVLAYLLYYAVSLGLGIAYNQLFLL
jgi:hypothetical protein